MSYNRGKKNKETLIITTREDFKQAQEKYNIGMSSIVERDHILVKDKEKEFKVFTYELPKERGSEMSPFLDSVLLSIGSKTDFNSEGKVNLARQHKEGKTILTIITSKNNEALAIDFNSKDSINNIIQATVWHRYVEFGKFEKKIVMYFEDFDSAEKWNEDWFNDKKIA